MNLEDYIKNLNPELQEKARECGSVEELLALAKEAKVPVPDEMLAAVAGGNDSAVESCGAYKCPACGSKDTECYRIDHVPLFYIYYFKCHKCGHEWTDKVIEG